MNDRLRTLRTTGVTAKRHDLADRMTRWVLSKAVGSLLVAMTLAAPAAAWAHSFSLAVVADEDQAATQLDLAVKGILLATRERDGHADETSDGHLGGLDVHVVPLPPDTAETIAGLKRVPQGTIDLAILIGPGGGTVRQPAVLDPQTVTIRAAAANTDTSEAPSAFASLFQDTYGTAPDRWAIDGYNAAGRIDLAVRPLGGVQDREALIAALAATADGGER